MKMLFRCSFSSNLLTALTHVAAIVLFLTLVFGCGGGSSSSNAQIVYVSSYGSNSIKQYNGTTGAFIGDLVPSGANGLSGPHALAFGSDGNVYVAGGLSNDVQRYNAKTGEFVDVFV